MITISGPTKEVQGVEKGAYYPIVWNLVLANPVLFDKPILNVKEGLLDQ
jgi:hypothetical protein